MQHKHLDGSCMVNFLIAASVGNALYIYKKIDIFLGIYFLHINLPNIIFWLFLLTRFQADDKLKQPFVVRVHSIRSLHGLREIFLNFISNQASSPSKFFMRYSLGPFIVKKSFIFLGVEDRNLQVSSHTSFEASISPSPTIHIMCCSAVYLCLIILLHIDVPVET